MVLIDHEQTKSVMMVAVSGVFQEFGMLLCNLLFYMASYLFYFYLELAGPFISKRFFCRL